MNKISKHTVQRLILYRKILRELIKSNVKHIFSHKLSSLAGNTPAQVRRDLMIVGYTGIPVKGYETKELEKAISEFLYNPEADKAVLVGLGHLGRAILNYCDGVESFVKIVAAFDIKQDLIGRIIYKIKCYDINELGNYVRKNKIKLGIITVPQEVAQSIADIMIENGILSILNFSNIKLKVPPEIFVENLDMMLSLEKASYFANNNK